MSSLSALAAGPDERSPWSSWWPAVAAALASVVGTVWLYRETALEAAATWWRSSAYNYCFLVIPIVIYLVWDRRATLALLAPVPCLAGLALIPASGAAWWIADLADIAEGRQLALVCLLQAMLFSVLGWRAYRALLFPFLYLLLLVPTGELLLGGLQEVSAGIATAALRLSGIPVYRDGILIEIPAGTFIVEAGCAGLNFLLSALALSLLFANLLYRGWTKRLWCIAVALGAALMVNWLRIYGIIVLAHATRGHAGLIDDHLFYGWGLFAAAMGGLVALAQTFRDAPAARPSASPPLCRPRIASFAVVTLAALLLAALPGIAAGKVGAGREAAIALPGTIGP